jgi:hypothetical protein
MSRLIVQEQDLAYEESLRADQEKVAPFLRGIYRP